MRKLKDPVEETQEEKVLSIDDEIDEIESSALTLEDLQQVSHKVTRRVSPFEGYPQEPFEFEGIKTTKTALVILNPMFDVPQDPNMKGRTVKQLDDNGNVIGEKIVDFETFHSRAVFDGAGNIHDVVFDRKIQIPDRNGNKKEYYCAIVPDHTARSQLFFTLTRRGATKVDNRYLMADPKQEKRLRKSFDNFHWQQNKGERNATSHEKDE